MVIRFRTQCAQA